MLGAGSQSLAMAYPNTCAGIKTTGVLSGVVMLKETSSVPVMLLPTRQPVNAKVVGETPHLEIVTGDPADPVRAGKVDLNDTSRMYGFYGRAGGSEKVKMM